MSHTQFQLKIEDVSITVQCKLYSTCTYCMTCMHSRHCVIDVYCVYALCVSSHCAQCLMLCLSYDIVYSAI